MMKNNLKNKKITQKNNRGITLIALVITIIVLLILAGISISMLSGDNSILSRAGQARDKTKETQKDEEVKVAVLGSYDDRASLDIDKLLTNLNSIKDITVTPTQENGKNTFPVTVETEYTTYEITSDGNNMTKYSELLNQSIESIINVKEESDIDSLFRRGGTTMLQNDIKGLEDFELIAFVVIV